MEDVNWDVVSAVSNIILSFLTFVGLMITLYFSLRNTFYKLKVTFDITKDQWQMKVINKRNIPVSLMIYGFTYKNEENRHIGISYVRPSRDNKRLEWNDTKRHKVFTMVLNEYLSDKGFKSGDTVQLHAVAKTEDGKIYAKKAGKFVVGEFQLNIKNDITSVH